MGARNLNLFKAIDFLLQIEKGPDAGRLYRIQPPKILVGRDPQCQIALTDPKVSRQQFAIQFTDNVTLIDLSSRKTTRVNGKAGHSQILKPGDIITFGDTQIRFNAKTNEHAQPQLTGQPGRTVASPPKDQQKNIRIFLFAIIGLVGLVLFLQEDPIAATQMKIITQEEVNKQIEESKERSALLRESYIEKKKMTEQNYLQNVEQHFIRGFRDFQNGQYGRAIESFGTTIATDETHNRAIQYNKAALKRREDLVDTHMQDGIKYKEKMMFNRCAVEFDKALVLINDVNSKKYDLAKTQRNECDLLDAGGRR